MGVFFPRWTNLLPLKLAVAVFLLLVGATVAIANYWTNRYSKVGYQPDQPIPFDHSLHAGQLGMDCRYCHTNVENASHANIPSAQTCWNCHQFVKKESDKLVPLRQAMDTTYEDYTGDPIKWVRIHQIADYAYFSHEVHVNRGVSCVSCHGKVNEMEVVYHHETQTMGWCLDCHRAPENHLRPLDKVTKLDWEPADMKREEFYEYLAAHSSKTPDQLLEAAKLNEQLKRIDFEKDPLSQLEIGVQLKEMWGVVTHEHCTACHR